MPMRTRQINLKRRLCVLLADNSPLDAQSIRETLTSSPEACSPGAGTPEDAFDLIHVTTLAEAMGYATSQEIDVILLSLGMADGKGLILEARILPEGVLTRLSGWSATSKAARNSKGRRSAQRSRAAEDVLSARIRHRISTSVLRRLWLPAGLCKSDPLTSSTLRAAPGGKADPISQRDLTGLLHWQKRNADAAAP